MKALLIVDVYDEKIPEERVTAIRFNDGDMLYVDTKLISVEKFIDLTFPAMYKKLVNAILYGEERKNDNE